VIIDAIVLAGGRASRLGGASKAGLAVGVRTLLQSTLAALAIAREVVVVGDADEIGAAAPNTAIMIAREVPAFAGPAAAIAAGVDALAALDGPADFIVVVGCDMPTVGDALDVMLAAVRSGSDGVVAVSSDGRAQPLVGVYSGRGLAACVARHRVAGNLEDLSVRALLADLNLDPVTAPDGSTDDVDTWADAARLGVLIPQPRPHPLPLPLPLRTKD
jgi:molybdopterin-guanine dinucleotide biosynthesis protein A